MFTCQNVCLLILLIFSVESKISNSGSTTIEIDLTNRTFIMEDREMASKTENDLDLFFIFHKDRRAIFRIKRGSKLLKDNPLSWYFEADSLCLQPGSISMEVEGQVHQIDRDPIKYAIEKAPGGYLLKGRDDQIILMEIK